MPDEAQALLVGGLCRCEVPVSLQKVSDFAGLYSLWKTYNQVLLDGQLALFWCISSLVVRHGTCKNKRCLESRVGRKC